MHTTKWKELVWKGCIHYDSNSLTFWKKQNWRESKKISGGQGLGREKGRMTGEKQISEDVKTILDAPVKVDTWHYASVKTHRSYNTVWALR